MTMVHRAAIMVEFAPQPSESADPADGRLAPIVLKKSANWRFWIGQCDSARVLDCA